VIGAGLLLAATVVFTPPRLVTGELPGLPPVTVIAGGEVLVELTVDWRGSVSRTVLLRHTAPYGQMVLNAVRGWRFAPAHAPDQEGREQVVEATVLVAAVYRPPTLTNGPTAGTAPLDVSRPSPASPYPLVMSTPVHPIQAFGVGVVLLELSLAESGITRAMRTIQSVPVLESAARDAVAQWRFRAASSGATPVPSRVYVIVGFPHPTLGSSVQ